MKKKVKLSSTQIWVIEYILEHGKILCSPRYYSNCRRNTADKLVELDICEWDYSGDYLVLTKLGKTFPL